MFGDMKKAVEEAKIAIQTLTLLNDRLEGLVERLEAAMPAPSNPSTS